MAEPSLVQAQGDLSRHSCRLRPGPVDEQQPSPSVRATVGACLRRPAGSPEGLPLLDERCPLPLTEPFTASQAREHGVSRGRLATLICSTTSSGRSCGVCTSRSRSSTRIEFRAAALALVVPPSAIVTDRTAAWLHRVDLLQRSAVHQMPPLEIYSRAGSRVRRPDVASGERHLRDEDVTVIDGVLVTTKLRTALDLGRRLNRFEALAALDGLLRAGVCHEDLLAGVDRFRGERGVVQLRWLAPLADPRAESPPESVLRLHWLDVGGMPPPEPQQWVHDAGYPRYRIDLTVPELRYGAEYNGAGVPRRGHRQRAAGVAPRRGVGDRCLRRGRHLPPRRPHRAAPSRLPTRATPVRSVGAAGWLPAEMTARRVLNLHE